jgi:hypothetical protein
VVLHAAAQCRGGRPHARRDPPSLRSACHRHRRRRGGRGPRELGRDGQRRGHGVTSAEGGASPGKSQGARLIYGSAAPGVGAMASDEWGWVEERRGRGVRPQPYWLATGSSTVIAERFNLLAWTYLSAGQVPL